MSLFWELRRQVPPDTAALGEELLEPSNIYRQIGDRFDTLFPQEKVFAPMYSTRGRHGIPPLLLALVTVFQMLEKVPDRTAAEWVVSRIDWKYALHLPLTYAGFHFTDLYAFRQRLLAHGQERLVFEQMLLKLVALGLLKARGKMRTDSTHVLAMVARLSQLELVRESLRVALVAAGKVDAPWVDKTMPPAFQETYGQRRSQYRLSKRQIREQLVQAGHDGLWFLSQVDHDGPLAVQQLAEVAVLRQVLEQQFPQGPDQPLEQRPTGGDVVESPHEPAARFGKKRGQGWRGYKVQVTETCDEEGPALVVDLEPTGALDNDSPELPRIQRRLAERELLPGEQYVDQGYMSGEHLVNSAEQGINLMGVPLSDTRGPDGFRQTDFDIDTESQEALCPAEQTSTVWSLRDNPEGGQPAVLIRFHGPTCQACAFFGRCTSSPQGRSLTLHPHRLALLQRRAEAQTDAFRQQMHLRAGIEATISELVRGYDLRHARYRGTPKLRLQAYFTAVAINLRRLVRWWTKPGTPQAGPAAA